MVATLSAATQGPGLSFAVVLHRMWAYRLPKASWLRLQPCTVTSASASASADAEASPQSLHDQEQELEQANQKEQASLQRAALLFLRTARPAVVQQLLVGAVLLFIDAQVASNSQLPTQLKTQTQLQTRLIVWECVALEGLPGAYRLEIGVDRLELLPPSAQVASESAKGVVRASKPLLSDSGEVYGAVVTTTTQIILCSSKRTAACSRCSEVENGSTGKTASEPCLLRGMRFTHRCNSWELELVAERSTVPSRTLLSRLALRLHHPDQIHQIVSFATAALSVRGSGRIASMLLLGPPGSGRLSIAEALVRSLGSSLLVLDIVRLFARGVEIMDRSLQEALQCACSQQPCVLFLENLNLLSPSGTAAFAYNESGRLAIDTTVEVSAFSFISRDASLTL